MNKLGKANLVILAAAAVLGVVAAVSLLLDATGLAVFCAVLLLEGLVLLEVMGRRNQQAQAQSAARQARDIAALADELVRIDRRVANVGERAVTEARATERTVVAAIAATEDLRGRSGADRPDGI